MANTTWNPSDKTANVTLTGSNLIATASGAGAWVRAVDRQVTGKFYWECKPTVWGNGNTAVGLCPATASPTIATSPGISVVTLSGTIWVDTINTGSSLGARAANDVIGIALDYSARLAWYRVAPAGNWNGSAAANPATGVGGVSVSSIAGGAIPAFPLTIINANLDSVTANFGDTAFTGAVPAGFTSGFTAGATINTNALATQVAAEHWFTTSPQSQVTQVALEHWATVADGVFVPPPSGANVAAMVLA